MSTETLRVIVVYHHARDYPQFNFVARQFFLVAGRLWPQPTLFATGETLRAVRDAVPPWMVCIPHQPGEDPVIVETWV